MIERLAQSPSTTVIAPSPLARCARRGRSSSADGHLHRRHQRPPRRLRLRSVPTTCRCAHAVGHRRSTTVVFKTADLATTAAVVAEISALPRVDDVDGPLTTPSRSAATGSRSLSCRSQPNGPPTIEDTAAAIKRIAPLIVPADLQIALGGGLRGGWRSGDRSDRARCGRGDPALRLRFGRGHGPAHRDRVHRHRPRACRVSAVVGARADRRLHVTRSPP